jgi:hypothetical protein
VRAFVSGDASRFVLLALILIVRLAPFLDPVLCIASIDSLR